MEILGVSRSVLQRHRDRQATGWTTVDIRSGKAIWVKPVIADVGRPPEVRDVRQVLRTFDETLREFQRKSVCGTITLVVCRGQVVDVERVVELEEVRVG